MNLPDKVKNYIKENKEINQHILVNLFDFESKDAIALLDFLREKEVLVESYFVLCNHCDSIVDSGILFEAKEKIKFRAKYKCWQCKKKVDIKKSKTLKNFLNKKILFNELREKSK